MNTNAKAINAFEKDRSDFVMVDCEYIELSEFFILLFLLLTVFILVEVRYLTNSVVFFGLLWPAF